MKIAVLLLCHEPPTQIAQRLASPFFASADVKVYLHYDGKRKDSDLARLQALIPDGVSCDLLTQRVACAWGEYSLVEATHRLMRRAVSDEQFQPDYLLLMSGSCMPIRPLRSLQEFLRRRQGIDFIQAVDISHRKWVKDGLERERYQFYFPFNFQRQRKLFERATDWQRRLGISREQPEGLRIHFGSQWFCLTRATAAGVCDQLDDPALRRFFAKSWIPDEFAIQTLVASVQKPAFIAGFNLTYYEFDDQGRPLVLDNGHFEHLMRQPFFLARKVSRFAVDLARQVAEHLSQPELDLSYFDRVGQHTSDYQRFIAGALTMRSTRSHVGVCEDPWRGVMDYNCRNYFVLYSASRSYLSALLTQARQGSDLPLFDYLFDPDRLVPAAEVSAWRGIQSGMRARRDYDPNAFLHELANLDANHACAFALDASQACWTRSFVLWDPNATLICCDPPGLSKQQRAEAFLRDLRFGNNAKLLEQTLQAATGGDHWLPQDHFAEAIHENKRSCQHTHLHQVDELSPSATLRALKAAVKQVDSRRHFTSPEEAMQRIRDPRALSY